MFLVGWAGKPVILLPFRYSSLRLSGGVGEGERGRKMNNDCVNGSDINSPTASFQSPSTFAKMGCSHTNRIIQV
jgi:hypothetical protein